jgi:penicillin-binding protein 1A
MAEPRLRPDPADRISTSRPPSRQPRPRQKRPRQKRPLRGGWVRLGVLVFLWAALIGGGVLSYFALTLPDTSQLGRSDRRPSLTILADDGSLLATYGDLFGKPLTLKEMSPWLPKAVIATEDRRFYHHFGIDPIGLARAALVDLRAGHIVEGGSTITQQLAKNLFLTPERSISRKIREVLLALWLEHKFTKDQILEIYLNRVYLGAGTYGVDAAARRYFDKRASRLSLFESAVIAGLLKAPTRFSPARDRKAAAARADQVLDNMVEVGYATRAEANAAEKQGAALADVAKMRPGTRYFADWVAEQAADYVAGSGQDLIIRTTLDPRMQDAAEAAIAETLARSGAKAGVGQGALVAMSPDGAVRAMVGGRDYSDSQFNRATEARRQPGSAFKPFVYLAGLEAGLRPGDHFTDAPIRVGKWQPHDYERHYRGDVTMAEGLADSLNAVAVEVALKAGIGNVIAVAHRLGIASTLPADMSLALGTGDVTLLELVTAYAPFANGGEGVWPHAIEEIRDGKGRVLFRRGGSGLGEVVALQLVGEMNAMLEGVIAHGTGRAAALPRPAAGKTGTTQDYRDAWFVGYTAQLVAGVWFGNDDDAPMRRVTGGSLPAATWRRFMLAATRGMPVRPLPGGALPAPPVATAEAPSPGLFDRLIGMLTAGAPSASQSPYPPGAGRHAGY